ncbi:hypothetical protein V5O48_015854 [Marasmius crinis-equi]|uniref:Uncharacterized protein n=1 Tax=Marasmius crinis-equi TaxID=585013 RepID=A0ABR3ETH2_9AGAR
MYPESKFDSPPQRFRVATGELVFIYARSLIARVFTNTNTNINTKTGVWAYRYDQPNPVLGSAIVAIFNGTRTGNNGTATSTFTPRPSLRNKPCRVSGVVRDHNPNV